MSNTGKAYLVGSGSGDYGLLTIKAKELIESAQVLIYDNLVNRRIISTLPNEDCEMIFVGKMSSNHTLKQEDINQLIVNKVKEGKVVVRLKGGDPYIFGRGGEEAIELIDNGIDFEIVNGISSAYSVPAYAGIPVTHRGIAASVAFITGHEDPTKNESDIHWDKIATGMQTLVFLMGVKNLPEITKQLIKHGRDKDTPVAVIQNGTYPTQKTVVGTLSTIYDKALENGIKPPSIIVVGDVVNLRDKLNWFEKKPLFGKSIVVTRAREQASKLVAKLNDLGANVIEVPSIKIADPDDPIVIKKSIENIDKYNWIIFTSVNGVIYFYKFLNEAGLDSRTLANKKICAIGPATAEKLKEFGIIADEVPPKYVSHEIVSSLSSINEIKGKSFLMPRADIAPKTLAESLLKEEASLVDDVTVYSTVEESFDESSDIKQILKDTQFDMVTFTSSSTATNFARILKNCGGEISNKIKCASIGPITAETAEKLGFKIDVLADEYTIDGLVDSILDYYKN